MAKIAKSDVASAISKTLIAFGYPDASCKKCFEIVDAWLAGKRGDELPHQVLGLFAERQIEDLEESAGKPLSEIIC